MIDLSSLSLPEMRQLQEQLNRELPRREKQEIENAREAIYQIAHGLNMPVETLINIKLPKNPKKGGPAVQFQDPTNPDSTWVGRGPRPQWLKQALAGGATLDDFRITGGNHPATNGA